MRETIPYTYIVRIIPTGQFYYGYRGRKGCHPDELGREYFSSSKLLLEMVSRYGPESFVWQVRRTFAAASEARAWERRFLQKVNARHNPAFLNQSNGGAGFSLERHTEESRAKISRARKGMVFSAEHKCNIGNAARGRITKDETKAKLSAAMSGRKLSDTTREKIRAKALGRSHTDITKAKISLTGKGRKLTERALNERPSSRRCMANGIEYRSLMDAARTLDVTDGCIKYRIDQNKPGYQYLD